MSRGICKALFAGMAALTLAACGGGGGGSDSLAPGVDTGANEVQLKVTTGRSSLPLNIAYEGASVGGQYTTELRISAFTDNGTPLISGTELAVTVASGIESGALAYLDGDSSHQEDVTVTDADGNEYTETRELLYRSAPIKLQAGVALLHVHALAQVGIVTINVSVQDPVTGKEVVRSVSVSVGGQRTGNPAQVLVDTSETGYGYMYVQGMGSPTKLVLQANLVDESGDQVSDPGAGVNNLRLRIVSDPTTTADDDAGLVVVNAMGETMTGNWGKVRSINGKALFTVVSGTTSGVVLVEMVADRSDNNVDNGIADPVYNYVAISVIDSLPSGDPLAITTETLADGQVGVAYNQVLMGEGGSLPYSWKISSLTKLPNGLYFKSDGAAAVIYGTPLQEVTEYQILVTLTDVDGTVVSKVFTITIAPETVVDTGSDGFSPATN